MAQASPPGSAWSCGWRNEAESWLVDGWWLEWEGGQVKGRKRGRAGGRDQTNAKEAACGFLWLESHSRIRFTHVWTITGICTSLM